MCKETDHHNHIENNVVSDNFWGLVEQLGWFEKAHQVSKNSSEFFTIRTLWRALLIGPPKKSSKAPLATVVSLSQWENNLWSLFQAKASAVWMIDNSLQPGQLYSEAMGAFSICFCFSKQRIFTWMFLKRWCYHYVLYPRYNIAACVCIAACVYFFTLFAFC